MYMIHPRGIQYPSHHGSLIDGDDDRARQDFQVTSFHPLPNSGHDQDQRVQPIACIQGIDTFDLAQLENQ
jgi:hypothetical protein